MGQPPPGQENGVTGAGQQFGRARGEYHDTKRWAMTVSTATEREIVNDPPPTDRQRKAGEPAFLRASGRPGSESLAALLMIYHSIPLAREALLLPNYQQFNYGCHPKWWTGHPIEAPKIVSLDEHRAYHNRDDVLIEAQRLMAFLDDTNRAYASVDALADLHGYQETEAESELSRFIEAWNNGALIRSRDDPLTQVFTSHGVRDDPESSMAKYFVSLEPMVDPEIEQSFIDILDNIIWADQGLEGALSDVWIDSIGEIMTLRLSDPKRKQGKLGIEIPAVWYLDRYMEHFREASRDMRMRKQNILRELRGVQRSKNNASSCLANGRQGMLDIRRALSDAAERAPLIVKNQSQQGTLTDPMSNPTPSSADVNECVRVLQDLVASIGVKLEEFEKARKELRAELRATTAELTKPEVESPLSPTHRYTLRGISTGKHITYVLQPAVEALPEAETGNTESDPWQWWRLSMSSEEVNHNPSLPFGPNPQPFPPSQQGVSNAANGLFSPWPASTNENKEAASELNGNVFAYSIRKVTEDDVLKAAREEDDSITLVYASDKAVSFQTSTLSGPLQMFVKADNKIFENELRCIEQPQGLEDVANGEEMIPLHLSSLDGMQDVPLIEDSDGTLNSERDSSTPATTALPARREADGQPSPKRAKGEDEPPSYHEQNRNGPEMQERSGGMGILGNVQPNRTGQHADRLTDKIKDDAASKGKGATHLEYSPGG